jgi:hypothetical protein
MTKSHILDAIRETTAKNNGLPLGQARFANETGISAHIWRGKFWLRWSEAIIEAGFSPNEWGKTYSTDFLLAKLAELTRSNKHFPTDPELRLTKTNDATFPSPEAFYRLEAKKSLRIELLRAFVSRTPEYSDIISFLPPTPAGGSAEDESQSRSDNNDVEGYVYMMRLGKHYKIGRTTAVPRRHREISLELPEQPSVVHCIRTDDPEGIERYWHGRFASLRANGEWFALTHKEVRVFKRRKFM